SNDLAGIAQAGGNGLLRSELIIDGAVVADANTIAWSLPRNLYFFLLQTLDSLTALAERQQYVRARVLVKGRTIWGSGTGALPFLDGQSFGVAATRADGRTP